MQDAMTNTNVNNVVVNVAALPVVARSQRNWLLRAIYFLLIGWWLSAFWISAAWLLAVTIIFLPVAQWMFLRINAVLTLQRLK